MTEHRFAVNVTPRQGILDPQGRAVEQSLPHLGLEGIHGVRVGRRVELTVSARSPVEARQAVERLASELLSNPLIEQFAIEELGGTSSADSAATNSAGTDSAAVEAPVEAPVEAAAAAAATGVRQATGA